MGTVQGNIFNIIKLFPEDKTTILRLLKENQNFQSMCNDYEQCHQALTRWNQDKSEKASERRKEYADLLYELKLEIRQCLNEQAS